MAEQEGGYISNNKGDVAQTAEGTIRERDDGRRRAEEGHQRLTVKAAFFYANDGMVASTDSGWLKSAFDTLTGLFDQVGLHINVRKTMGVVCRPCQAARVRTDESYTQRMAGEGWSFKEWQQERVICLESVKDMAKGSMVTYRQI